MPVSKRSAPESKDASRSPSTPNKKQKAGTNPPHHEVRIKIPFGNPSPDSTDVEILSEKWHGVPFYSYVNVAAARLFAHVTVQTASFVLSHLLDSC